MISGSFFFYSDNTGLLLCTVEIRNREIVELRFFFFFELFLCLFFCDLRFDRG